MAAASPRPKSKVMRSEISLRTHVKLRKSELDLEKEYSRLEQQTVNRLVTKEREIKKYVNESQSQQQLKTSLTRTGSVDGEINWLDVPNRPRSASAGDMSFQSKGGFDKSRNRLASDSRSPRPSARNIPTILVDDDEQAHSQLRLVKSSPTAATGPTQESSYSSRESTPSCSPASSPLIMRPQRLESSSTDALGRPTATASSLEPVQRAQAKSASGPLALCRVKSLPVGSPDIIDKETLLEMAQHFPDLKGKDGFKQFYQCSSPKPKKRWGSDENRYWQPSIHNLNMLEVGTQTCM